MSDDLVAEMPSMKRVRVTARVMEALRDEIASKRLQPGDLLPTETALAQQLGTSRTPVREAIMAMSAMGIIEVRHGHGIFVKGFDFDALLESLSFALAVSPRQIGELLDVREGLELAFVPAVLATITPEDLSALDAIVQAMAEQAGQGTAFPELDQDFHLGVYRCTGNDLLLRLIRVFWVAIRQLRGVYFSDSMEGTTVHVVADNHTEILQALRLGDADLVRERITEHYEPLRRQIRGAG